jgi:hypothetical protein
VIGIICLLIGASVVSSTEFIVKDLCNNKKILDIDDSSEELLLHFEYAYAYCAYDPSGQLNEGFVYFDLMDPGFIKNINNISNPGLMSAGTWACNEKFLVCDPINGYLWKIDPINGEVVFIGGGGVGLNGLTYDTCDIELYGCSSNELYKIDQYSGEQTYIGSFSSGPVNMVGLASNCECDLYGWDTGTDNLWMIDKETAECELVGSLGIDLNYTTDGHFHFEYDVLYLAVYTTKGQLYECDENTGECDLVGDFQGGAHLTAFVIPFICFNIPPSAPKIIGYENETLSFYSNDPNDDDVKYFIDWDDGEVTETGWYPSGQIVEISHELPEPGVYYIRVKAMDICGYDSPWSVYMIVIGNLPPEAPIIDGPIRGKVGVEHTYTFNSTDYDGDLFCYYVDWGDDSPIEIVYPTWSYPEEPGPGIANHSWDTEGIYIISAYSEDELGLVGPTGNLTVTMPRNKPTNNMLFLRILERFPLLQKLFQHFGL